MNEIKGYPRAGKNAGLRERHGANGKEESRNKTS